MAFVARELASDPTALRRVFETHPAVLVGFSSLMVLNQFLMSLRMSLAITHCAGTQVPKRVWMRLVSIGQMLNLFVPQLGTAYRAWSLKREYDISYMSYASGLFAFVWLDVVAGCTIALVSVGVLEPSLHLRALPVLPALGALVVALTAAPAIGARLLRSSSEAHSRLRKLRERLSRLLGAASSLFGTRSFYRFLLLSLLVTLEQTTALALLFDSVGADISLSALLLFQVLLKISNQVVITPGNLGVLELMFGVLSYGAECTVEQGLTVALVFRALTGLVTLTLGVGFGGVRLLRERRNLMISEESL